jgi:hypothetical protein
MIINETSWSLGAQSHTFQERGVLDLLGHSLKKVYGEPERDALPEEMQKLISRLEQAECGRMRASDR